MAEMFKGQNLKKLVDGEFVDVDPKVLEGKVVALYFSAHWCPPCRGFTPELKDVYEKILAAGNAFEIVFISCDQDLEAQKEYMKESHGNWLALPQGDPFAKQLMDKYGVRGIPTLIVIKSNGDVVTDKARGNVMNDREAAFQKWAGQV